MINSPALLIITLVSIISWQILAIPNGFTINQKYFWVGKKVVQMGQLIHQYTANWTNTPATVTIPTPQYNDYSYNSWYSASLSFGDVQTSNLTYINIRLETETPYCYYFACDIHIYTSNANSIQRLGISYLFFNLQYYYSQYFPYQLRCYTFSHYFGNNITNNILDTLTIVENIQSTDFSSELVALPIFINGIVASSTDSTMTKSILLAAQLTSASTVNVTISSSSPIPTYLEYLSYSFCTNLQVSTSVQQKYQSFYKIYSGQLAGQNTNSLSYSNNHLLMNNINTFIGLSSFTISNQNVFNISASVDDEHSLSISSSTFDKLQMTYFILYSDYCSYKTPFYEPITNQCYQICPQNTTQWYYFICRCQIYIQGKQACISSSSSSSVSVIAICFGTVSILIHVIFFVQFIVNDHRNKNLKEIDEQANEGNGGHVQHISRQEMAINSIDVTLMHLPQLNVENHLQNIHQK